MLYIKVMAKFKGMTDYENLEDKFGGKKKIQQLIKINSKKNTFYIG